MTEEVAVVETTNEVPISTESVVEAPRLYAGKFNSIEELEEGYKNSAKVYDANQALTKQLSDFTTIPEDYSLPEGMAEMDGINEIKHVARQSGINQTQFDKMVKAAIESETIRSSRMEEAKKSIGEPTLQVLDSYIKKLMPDKLAGVVMDQLIVDADARNAVLKQREDSLKSKVPGIDSVSVDRMRSVKDLQKEALDARNQMMATPHDPEAQQRYLEIVRQVALAKETQQ
jgi:hypothetical protein